MREVRLAQDEADVGVGDQEAIAVDDQLGYVYYSDEGKGVRKYYADPEKGNDELALFATTGFTEDHEGISIYQLTDSTGRRFAYVDTKRLLLTDKIESYVDHQVSVTGTVRNTVDGQDLVISAESMQVK